VYFFLSVVRFLRRVALQAAEMAVDRDAAPTPPLAPLRPDRQSLSGKSARYCQLALAAGFSDNDVVNMKVQAMRARIYQPAKTAMSSGTAMTKSWVLEFSAASARQVDPLMGWTSSRDMQSQVRLSFESSAAALDYANENGIDAVVIEPRKRAMNIRPGGYGDNFATHRRTVWTH
jgi:NADH dehydrogenase